MADRKTTHDNPSNQRALEGAIQQARLALVAKAAFEPGTRHDALGAWLRASLGFPFKISPGNQAVGRGRVVAPAGAGVHRRATGDGQVEHRTSASEQSSSASFRKRQADEVDSVGKQRSAQQGHRFKATPSTKL